MRELRTEIQISAPINQVWQVLTDFNHWKDWNPISGLIFTNDRVFELEEKRGGTELINKEEFSGLMVPLFWSKMNQFVVPMLEK